MTTTTTPANSHPAALIEDVQSRVDSRHIAINKVGIKDISHPVRIHGRDGQVQHTVANFCMTVFLPEQFKGTHMSRFVEILNLHEPDLSIPSFRQLLKDMTQRLDSSEGYVEASFPYFVMKTAPVSGVKSLMNYQATLIGSCVNGTPVVSMKVVVPVTSLCPCSKKISDYGAHNQRSHVTISAQSQSNLWLEDLIDIAEQEASCEVYAILKRPDEKYVTERAYDNPKFVEDMARDLAIRLNADERIDSYVVEVENLESIHNHSAYALIERKKSQ